MARKKSSTNTSSISYEQFLKEIQLVDLSLVSSSSLLREKDYIAASSKKRPLNFSITSKYELNKCGDNFFTSTAKFQVAVEDAKSGTKPIAIECAFVGHFHAGFELMKNDVERFTSSEFRIIVWPYLREFVQQITARMSVLPLIVPLSLRNLPE